MTKYIDPETKKPTTIAKLLKKIRASKKALSSMNTFTGKLGEAARLSAFEMAAGFNISTSSDAFKDFNGMTFDFKTAKIDSKGVSSVDVVPLRLVKLSIKYGAYDFNSFVVTRENNVENVAKFFYDDEGGSMAISKPNPGYYFNGTEIYVEVVSDQEITEKQYELLITLGIVVKVS